MVCLQRTIDFKEVVIFTNILVTATQCKTIITFRMFLILKL